MHLVDIGYVLPLIRFGMSKLPIGFRCSTDRFKKSKQAQARVEEIDEKIRQVINNLRKSE
jgi:hypothetical protein